MKPLRFGRYETLFLIARGGMAEVYAAKLTGPHGFEKLVAVKRLLPELNNHEFITMFQDEAMMASRIVSDNVVQTFDQGEAEDGAQYLVMELVVGATLFDLTVHNTTLGGLPIEVASEIISQAAAGLHDAHESRAADGQLLHLVHRDVSPQNILVGTDGRVRVTDFGIARAAQRQTETLAGQLKGKVGYLSPEQARGLNVDRRSDVFSLGVVAWEALTGVSLFGTGNHVETLTRVLELPIPDPRIRRPDIPEPIAKVILWALERDLNDRCPSAEVFAQELRRVSPRFNARGLSGFIHTNGGQPLSEMMAQLDAHISDGTYVPDKTGYGNNGGASNGLIWISVVVGVVAWLAAICLLVWAL